MKIADALDVGTWATGRLLWSYMMFGLSARKALSSICSFREVLSQARCLHVCIYIYMYIYIHSKVFGALGFSASRFLGPFVFSGFLAEISDFRFLGFSDSNSLVLGITRARSYQRNLSFRFLGFSGSGTRGVPASRFLGLSGESRCLG